MKAIAYILAMATSLAVAVTVTFANPAMMKKDRPGYSSAGTTATNLYGSEALKAAVANEPKDAYPENLTPIKERDQLQRGDTELCLPFISETGEIL